MKFILCKIKKQTRLEFYARLWGVEFNYHILILFFSISNGKRIGVKFKKVNIHPLNVKHSGDDDDDYYYYYYEYSLQLPTMILPSC